VHGKRTLEITWTAIPALILAVMFVLTVQTMVFADGFLVQFTIGGHNMPPYGQTLSPDKLAVLGPFLSGRHTR